MQALAAVLGGTQSLHCNGRDEALALPTEESARVALRTQQIIAFESGVANTIDPVAGSYALEEMTNHIEQGAQALLDRIHAAGGTLSAIEQGIIQREIQESAYRAQQKIDGRESIVVGVNQFETKESAAVDVLQIDPQVEERQIARVRQIRASRDRAACEAALSRVTSAARDSENLVPRVLEAVEARATLGEIADAMRVVFGEHKELDV